MALRTDNDNDCCGPVGHDGLFYCILKIRTYYSSHTTLYCIHHTQYSQLIPVKIQYIVHQIVLLYRQLHSIAKTVLILIHYYTGMEMHMCTSLIPRLRCLIGSSCQMMSVDKAMCIPRLNGDCCQVQPENQYLFLKKKFTYYSRIILDSFCYLLFSKLC